MTITIPDSIARAAETMAQGSGSTAEHLLLQALQAHFPPVDPELLAEFDVWERASDETMARLDRDEDLGWR